MSYRHNFLVYLFIYCRSFLFFNFIYKALLIDLSVALKFNKINGNLTRVRNSSHKSTDFDAKKG